MVEGSTNAQWSLMVACANTSLLYGTVKLTSCLLCRPAICAERRRSSATVRCPPVRTASTTRPSVSLLKWKRREIRQKGALIFLLLLLDRIFQQTFYLARRLTSCFGMVFRAKYIEGLENRLGRMESLLRLSGTFGAARLSLVLLSHSLHPLDPIAISICIRFRPVTNNDSRSAE